MSLVPAGASPPAAAAEFVAGVVAPALQNLEVRAASFVGNALHQQQVQQHALHQQHQHQVEQLLSAQRAEARFGEATLRAELDGRLAGTHA